MKTFKNVWKKIIYKHPKVTITLGDSIIATLSIVLLLIAWINFASIQNFIDEVVDTVTNKSPNVVTIGDEEWEDLDDLTVNMSDEEIKQRKEVIIKNVCVLIERNTTDLYQLLQRADICSEDWFIEYDNYIKRLEEQDGLLEGQTSNSHKETKRLQQKVLAAMKEFREDQSKDNLGALEKAITSYQALPIEVCKGEVAYAK